MKSSLEDLRNPQHHPKWNIDVFTISGLRTEESILNSLYVPNSVTRTLKEESSELRIEDSRIFCIPMFGVLSGSDSIFVCQNMRVEGLNHLGPKIQIRQPCHRVSVTLGTVESPRIPVLAYSCR
jgi:hypothetical protein